MTTDPTLGAAATSDATGLREAVEALAAEWATTVYKIPPGYPMDVNRFCGFWFKQPLLDILAAHPDPTREPDAGEDDALEQTLVAYDERGGMFGTSGAGAYFLATHLLASDWLANHDAEVARTAAKEERERIAQAIEAQESCASPAGECYRDHEGCYVADSLRIAREEGRA